MNNLNEALLNSWLRLSTAINNTRLVSEMTYNESLVCNILYKNAGTSCPAALTATDLCNMTNILKSQMNRTLNQLEGKNMITRIRSLQDKRQVLITMNMEQCSAYETQHLQILHIMDAVIQRLGEEKAGQTIQLLDEISDIAHLLNLGK